MHPLQCVHEFTITWENIYEIMISEQIKTYRKKKKKEKDKKEIHYNGRLWGVGLGMIFPPPSFHIPIVSKISKLNINDFISICKKKKKS